LSHTRSAAPLSAGVSDHDPTADRSSSEQRGNNLDDVFKGLLPESQGQNLALTVLSRPCCREVYPSPGKSGLVIISLKAGFSVQIDGSFSSDWSSIFVNLNSQVDRPFSSI
jgi:hypothetical protein